MNVPDILEAPERCPLCGTPWTEENRHGYCDHEANWYRRWLAELSAALQAATAQ